MRWEGDVEVMYGCVAGLAAIAHVSPCVIYLPSLSAYRCVLYAFVVSAQVVRLHHQFIPPALIPPPFALARAPHLIGSARRCDTHAAMQPDTCRPWCASWWSGRPGR